MSIWPLVVRQHQGAFPDQLLVIGWQRYLDAGPLGALKKCRADSELLLVQNTSYALGQRHSMPAWQLEVKGVMPNASPTIGTMDGNLNSLAQAPSTTAADYIAIGIENPDHWRWHTSQALRRCGHLFVD